MNTATQTIQSKTITLKSDEVKRLFALSSELADYTERILEESGEYTNEFRNGLEQSLQEADNGMVKQISSLNDL